MTVKLTVPGEPVIIVVITLWLVWVLLLLTSGAMLDLVVTFTVLDRLALFLGQAYNLVGGVSHVRQNLRSLAGLGGLGSAAGLARLSLFLGWWDWSSSGIHPPGW